MTTRILSKDFFEIRPGNSFKFPPPKATGESDFTIEEKLPAFDAAVNTVVTILERISFKNDNAKEERDNNLVKFVKIKKRLKEIIPWDMKTDALKRMMGLDKLVHGIEKTGAEYLKIQGDKWISTLKGIATYEDDDFRIRIARQGELLENLETSGKTVKWGQYLRAPDVYFEILEKCKDKLVEQVVNEIIPNGPRKFPEEFIERMYLKGGKEISIPGEPLKLGENFMGQQEIVSDGAFKYTASKLFQAFFTRTHDHKLAERLTMRVMDETGLSFK